MGTVLFSAMFADLVSAVFTSGMMPDVKFLACLI